MKSLLDKFKLQSLSDTFCDVPLPPLNGLLSAPVISKDLNGFSFKAELFSSIFLVLFYSILFQFYSRINGSSPAIYMIPY